MSGWQTIESAPKDGTEFDAWVRAFSVGEGGSVSSRDIGRYPDVWWGQEREVYTGPYEERLGDEGWLYKDRLHSLLIESGQYRVTHWQPLPDPPA